MERIVIVVIIIVLLFFLNRLGSKIKSKSVIEKEEELVERDEHDDAQMQEKSR